MNTLKKTCILAVLSLALVACGDEADNNGNSANNGGNNSNNSNNGANNSNNGANNSNNGANNSNNGSTNSNNGSNSNNGAAYDQPFISSFVFNDVGQTCGALNLCEGNSIQTFQKTLGNLQGRSEIIADSGDWADVESTIITNVDFIRNIQNGFDCDAPPAGSEGVLWEIEVTIIENGSSNKLTDVTGCIFSDDAKTLPMVELLNELDAKYLPPAQ